MRSQINLNNTLYTIMIILITSMKEIHYVALYNTSNREYLLYSCSFMQIPPCDSASPNVNSGTANMTNTPTFVCHNHIRYQTSQNQSIDLHISLEVRLDLSISLQANQNAQNRNNNNQQNRPFQQQRNFPNNQRNLTDRQ